MHVWMCLILSYRWILWLKKQVQSINWKIFHRCNMCLYDLMLLWSFLYGRYLLWAVSLPLFFLKNVLKPAWINEYFVRKSQNKIRGGAHKKIWIQKQPVNSKCQYYEHKIRNLHSNQAQNVKDLLIYIHSHVNINNKARKM